MFGYAVNNLKKNKRKFAVVFSVIIVAVALILFALEIVSNLSKEMKIRAADSMAQDDIESMIMMMTGGVILLTLFVAVIVNNIFSVLIIGREQEFTLLYRLGMTEKRIRNLVRSEVIVISIVSFASGVILEKILSMLFIKRIDLLVHHSLPILWYVLCMAGLVILMVWSISKNFNNIVIKHGTKNTCSDANKKYTLNLVSGVVMLAGAIGLSFADADNDSLTTVKYVLIMFGITLLSKYLVKLTIDVLCRISEKNKYSSLYIASKQNKYNIKKMQSAISTVAVAVAFFVGFKGIYGSIEKSVEKFVRESVNYEYMIIFDETDNLQDINKLDEKLNSLKGEKGKYTIALTEVFRDKVKDSDYGLTLTGVDESYFDLQRFYMIDDTDKNVIFNNDGKLNVIFSEKEAKKQKLGVGDVIADRYEKDGSDLSIEIGALYEPINLKQAFTSRKSLALARYGREDAYNAFFVNNFSKKDIDAVLADYPNVKYDVYNMKEIVNASVEKAVNGTEMIEILIYSGVVFVTALVINMFILSIGDRKKQYHQLRMLGFRRKDILKSIMIESGMIYLFGAALGFFIAIPAVKMGLMMMKEELMIDTVLHIPLLLTGSVIVLMFAAIMFASRLIGNKCLKNEK